MSQSLLMSPQLNEEQMIDESLRAIVVAGVSSGAGKTSVAEAVTGFLARERGRLRPKSQSLTASAAARTAARAATSAPHSAGIFSSSTGSQLSVNTALTRRAYRRRARVRSSGLSHAM
ncbi:MAG TPA: hypothetical protein VGC91_04550 [Pyrinomonadaceae bacterium]